MFKKNINYFFLKFFFDNKEFQKKKKNFLKKNGNILLNYNLIKKGVKNQKQKYFYNLNCIKFATFKKKKFFFLRVQSKNKPAPNIFLTKNFKKIKTIFLGNKQKSPNPVACIFENLKIDIHFFLNKRFIFKFLSDFFFCMYTNKNLKNFFYLQIYRKKKPLRFIKKHPKMKKKYRKLNLSNKLIQI